MSLAIRYFLLDVYSAPPSGDFGNYLNIVNILEGTDVTGHGLRYPPLFFLILAPFIHVLGEIASLKIVAAAVASSSCVPMFLLAKRWANYPAAIAVTILFTFSQAMAEMTAWGGSPNFLAITFYIFTIYYMDRAFSPVRSFSKNALMAGVLAGLVFEAHHLTAVVLGLTLVLFFLFVLTWEGSSVKKKALKILVWMAVPAIVVSLPGLPTYLRIQNDLSSSLGGYGPASLTTIFGPGGFGYLAGVYWLAWAGVFAIGGATIGLLIYYKRQVRTYQLLLASSLVSPVILGTLIIGEAPGRVLFFMTIPLLLGFGIFIVAFLRWANRLPSEVRLTRELKNLIVVLFATDVLIMSAAGVQWMGFAVEWYHPVEDGDLDALDWIKENTAVDSTFATSGKMLAGHKEGDRLGWWIQGYSERAAVMAGSERFRLFEDELQATRDMNRFFSGTHVLENGRFQVSDQYPVAYRGNPEIAVRQFGLYQPIVFLNDGMHMVTYREHPLSLEQYTETFVDAQRNEIQILSTESTVATRATLVAEHFQFSRETVLTEGDTTADLLFHVRPVSDARVLGMTLYLWCPHGYDFENMAGAGSSWEFDVTDPWHSSKRVSVSIAEGNGLLVGADYELRDPRWSLPALRFNFTATENLLDIMISITCDTGEIDESAPLGYYNGYDLLRKYGVDYLFESTTMGLEIERLRKDTDHFVIAYETPVVVIFQFTDRTNG
jgi:hypothetical protein